MMPPRRHVLDDGELRRLKSEWHTGYLTRVQLAARFGISDKRVIEICAGIPRLALQDSDRRRQRPRVARALA